jgi:hypothetical protein
MSKYLKLLPFFLLMISSCSSDDEDNNIAWDESIQGELSGELINPTSVNFQFGDNRIIGSSTPTEGAECTTF